MKYKTIFAGFGQSGSGLVERLLSFNDYKKDTKKLQFITSVTDNNNYSNSILVDKEGSGKNVIEGRKKFLNNKTKDLIRSHLFTDPCERIVIFFGMGGGSGATLGPEAAKMAIDKGIETVVIPIIPFKEEGPIGAANFISSWTELYKYCKPDDDDRITVIPMSNEIIGNALREEILEKEIESGEIELTKDEEENKKILKKRKGEIPITYRDVNESKLGIFDLFTVIADFSKYASENVRARSTVDYMEHHNVVYGRTTTSNVKTGGGIIGYFIKDFKDIDDLYDFMSSQSRLPKPIVGDSSTSANVLISVAIPEFISSIVEKAESALSSLVHRSGSVLRTMKVMYGINECPIGGKDYKEPVYRLIILYSECTINKILGEYRSIAKGFIKKQDRLKEIATKRTKSLEEIPQEEMDV